MNNIDKAYLDSTNFSEFVTRYFAYIRKIQDNINLAEIEELLNILLMCRENNSTVFVAGNGGSAATATTMANDIGFDIIKKTGTDKPFKVMSLTDNNSVITAIANDVGYDNIFINQLKIHYKDDDVLLVISASGNSPNIIDAANWVKDQGGKVLGLLGFDGGKLLKLCDSSILVKTKKGEFGPVEDAHLIINHIIAHWFQNKLNN